MPINQIDINEKLNYLKNADVNNNSNIQDSYDSWLSNITPENIDIINSLFGKIDYYSEKAIKDALYKLVNNNYDINTFIDSTCVLYLESVNPKHNSSYIMTSFFVEIFNTPYSKWTKQEYQENIGSVENIAFFDDFCGSGTTFIIFISDNIELFKDKKILFFVIHIQEEAERRIYQFASSENLHIVIHSYVKKQKAFKEGYIFTKKELRTVKTNYKKECEKLKIQYKLGECRSEALVVTYRKTPNNTLGIFWEETDHNKPIFKRVRPLMPAFVQKARNESRIRREMNYANTRKY